MDQLKEFSVMEAEVRICSGYDEDEKGGVPTKITSTPMS
ncbi:hypothetical protein A2U01_0075005, partial [Trifolium medium]|nr:hypothetical protein [Trifolium medium]